MVTLKEPTLDPSMFDDSPEDDELYGFELQDNLTEEEIEEALKIANKWHLLRGLMIVTGPIGSGKDLWANVLSYKLKRYFKGRKAFKDEKPRKLFGYYEPFDTLTVAQELTSDGELPKEISRQNMKVFKHIASLSEQWLLTIGEEKLHNGVLQMTEFWRYMHNRQPFNPMGILLGAIIKRWRHLDLLIIGNAPRRHELDRYSCLHYVTHDVRCSWVGNGVAQYRVIPVQYVSTVGILKKRGKDIKITIDGNKPRESLNGKRYFDLFVSKSRTSIQGVNKL